MIRDKTFEKKREKVEDLKKTRGEYEGIEGRLLEACETERERQGVSVSISRDEKEETEEEVVADSALSSM